MERVEELLAAAGLGPATAATRLGEANYNTAYRVVLASGRRVVVKLAPTAPGLTYERDLLTTEALFFSRARGVAPVPEVLHAAPGALVLSELPGANWHVQRSALGSTGRLRRDLGRLAAALHTVTGTGFGYPQLGLRPTWRAAFSGMVGALLADAERYRPRLPAPVSRLAAAFARHAGDLDAVTVPSLVHFDLWPGNVLVHEGELTGVVDGERAFWGDPAAEFASLCMFAEVDADLLAGYGPADLARLPMYRAYLYLVMLVETVPRGYTDPGRAAVRERAAEHLLVALAELEGSPV